MGVTTGCMSKYICAGGAKWLVNRWQTFERGRECGGQGGRTRLSFCFLAILATGSLPRVLFVRPDSNSTRSGTSAPGKHISSEDMYTMAKGMHVGHIAACLGRARNDMRKSNDKWRRGWVRMCADGSGRLRRFRGVRHRSSRRACARAAQRTSSRCATPASLARACDHAPSQRAREPRDGTTATPTPLPARERGNGACLPDGTQARGSPRQSAP